MPQAGRHTTSGSDTRLFSPSDLGLPSKFKEFRRGQDKLALGLSNSPHRFSLLSAPTGAGKSLIYTAASKLIGGRALVLVGTKGLQQQLLSDFHGAGMVDIRGRNNYTCPSFGTCDEPSRSESLCPQATPGGRCPYAAAVSAARAADLVVSNYSYWMSIEKYGDGNALGSFDLLVMDEAHTAQDWLTQACTIVVSWACAEQALGSYVSLPARPSVQPVAPMPDWIDWADHIIGLSEDVSDKYSPRYEREFTLLIRELKGFVQSAGGSEDYKPRPWVVNVQGRAGVSLTPVWPQFYAERLMFRGIPRVILASATLSELTGMYLGIPREKREYIEVDSNFDSRRAPLVYIPTTRVDRKMVEGQSRVWVNRIDQILAGREDRKGVIHTRSYQRAQEIVQRSKHGKMMLTHSGGDTLRVVERFKAAKAPCVLVSPSVEEGFDFPGDECRYQIIAKVPFVDTRDPLIEARVKMDKAYGNYLTALSMIQMTGRGMRSESDWCETFIVDDHWQWFQKAVRFPDWYRRAWRWDDKTPPAMQAPR